MKKLLNQAFGYEPEPVWMSALGLFGALSLPILIILYAVALGGGQ